jgi:hypothetical protein
MASKEVFQQYRNLSGCDQFYVNEVIINSGYIKNIFKKSGKQPINLQFM